MVRSAFSLYTYWRFYTIDTNEVTLRTQLIESLLNGDTINSEAHLNTYCTKYDRFKLVYNWSFIEELIIALKQNCTVRNRTSGVLRRSISQKVAKVYMSIFSSLYKVPNSKEIVSHLFSSLNNIDDEQITIDLCQMVDFEDYLSPKQIYSEITQIVRYAKAWSMLLNTQILDHIAIGIKSNKNSTEHSTAIAVCNLLDNQYSELTSLLINIIDTRIPVR